MPKAEWNHNLHYHPLFACGAPRLPCRPGCWLRNRYASRAARSVSDRVLGIDVDETALSIARSEHRGTANLSFELQDFLTTHVEPGGVDLITMVAVLHHMPTRQALEKGRSLLAAGAYWPRSGCIGLPQ